MSQITILKNANIFDGLSDELMEDFSVVVEDGIIRDVSQTSTNVNSAHVVDCQNRVLMPGLIDAHFHAYTPSFDILANDRMPPALLASHAAKILEGTLRRGFTTVRDAAGGDIGLWRALEAGLISGPRFYYAGKAISQTGGHGDMRLADEVEICACTSYSGSLTQIADGPDEMRKAVREELRKGAHQIKLMVSGGVFSPTDPIWMPQFTDEEISTAVYEASTRKKYVMVHCHTDDAARRSILNGVRSIEHGTEISEDTARLIREKEAFVVPTLSPVDLLNDRGQDMKVSKTSLEKSKGVMDKMLYSIENCIRAGVSLGLGTDLLEHEFHPRQGAELELRRQVNSEIEILRSATSINAKLLQMEGKLGCIKPDAFADLLVLDGNPLLDLSLFKDPDRNIRLIMRGGDLIRSTL